MHDVCMQLVNNTRPHLAFHTVLPWGMVILRSALDTWMRHATTATCESLFIDVDSQCILDMPYNLLIKAIVNILPRVRDAFRLRLAARISMVTFGHLVRMLIQHEPPLRLIDIGVDGCGCMSWHHLLEHMVGPNAPAEWVVVSPNKETSLALLRGMRGLTPASTCPVRRCSIQFQHSGGNTPLRPLWTLLHELRRLTSLRELSLGLMGMDVALTCPKMFPTDMVPLDHVGLDVRHAAISVASLTTVLQWLGPVRSLDLNIIGNDLPPAVWTHLMPVMRTLGYQTVFVRWGGNQRAAAGWEAFVRCAAADGIAVCGDRGLAGAHPSHTMLTVAEDIDANDVETFSADYANTHGRYGPVKDATRPLKYGRS